MSTKDSDKKLPLPRFLQKRLTKLTSQAAEVIGGVTESVKVKIQEVDQASGISTMLSGVCDKAIDQVRDLNHQHDLSGKAERAVDYTREVSGKAVNTAKQWSDKSGASDLVQRTVEQVSTAVVEPAREAIRKTGAERVVSEIASNLEQGYGKTRGFIKRYSPAEDPRKLLTNARQELVKTSACLMQISSSDSAKLASQFGNAVLAKATGVAATTTLLSLVAVYGTAGTGTAIASLSGAAATNATLAWVGGLLGGGMATGAVLTGGVGLVAGLAAYKLLSSERRAFESLSEIEQRLVQTCWLAIAIIDEYLAGSPEQFTEREAEQLLVNIFRPLLDEMQLHQKEICANLDGTHAITFRQHILIDLRRVVIDGFERYIAGYPFKGFASAEYMVGGVFYALLSQSAVGDDTESQLVLDALRRSSTALAGAGESELGEYLRGLSPEALRGVGANVKGIYHELLFVQNYNAAHTDTYAEVFGATNHPGADIQIRDADTQEVVEEVQLKAVMAAAKIDEHLEKYPDISVLATNEVAEQFADVRVGSSGHDNETLQGQVSGDFAALAENSIGNRGGDAALMAAGIASARELMEMLRGERSFPDATVNVVKHAGTAGAATVLTAYLFG